MIMWFLFLIIVFKTEKPLMIKQLFSEKTLYQFFVFDFA